jgi:dephospho-CoA kinase
VARGDVVRVALTGGIATGKSVCLERFGELGAATLDTDQVARDAVAPGTPALDAIVTRFGRGFLLPDGSLDRAALGRLVFADGAARRDLEAIVHPAVYESVNAWFDALERDRASGQAASPLVGVVGIPLLYETGREGDFDHVVVAACPPGMQLARLMERDGLDEADAQPRIAAQWPIEEKARRADFVIDTSGTIADTLAGVDRVWERLRASGAPGGPGGPGVRS